MDESLIDRMLSVGGRRVLRLSALSIGGGPEVFESVLSGKDYRTVIEIGTFRGCTAAWMSQFCERVVTFDLQRGRMEEMSYKVDRETFWNEIGVNNVELRLVKDDVEKSELISKMEFDLAFVDGAHGEESVRSDFELVRRCGRVLFHDYSTRYGKDGVYRVVSQIEGGRVTVLGDVFAYWER